MKILFIQTGGTIDKDYPHTTKGWAFEFGEAAAKRVLTKLNPSFDYEIITAFKKDSLEVTDEDRQKLLELILQHHEEKIIITHGTDTMMETGKYLLGKVGSKLIIITGAMRPEMFTNSDADLNIGAAIATANLKQSGVYLAMHGIVKPVSEIKRNMETGKYF
jgi:L-asparaginase